MKAPCWPCWAMSSQSRGQQRGLQPRARQMESVSLCCRQPQTTKESCLDVPRQWKRWLCSSPCMDFKGRRVDWVWEGGISLTQLNSDFWHQLGLASWEGNPFSFCSPCTQYLQNYSFHRDFHLFFHLFFLEHLVSGQFIVGKIPGLWHETTNKIQFCPKDLTV